jgi:hypothetical protein
MHHHMVRRQRQPDSIREGRRKYFKAHPNEQLGHYVAYGVIAAILFTMLAMCSVHPLL